MINQVSDANGYGWKVLQTRLDVPDYGVPILSSGVVDLAQHRIRLGEDRADAKIRRHVPGYVLCFVLCYALGLESGHRSYG